MGNSGHPVVRTPHLDRLAEQSYAFDSAYCNSPICTPHACPCSPDAFRIRLERGIWEQLRIGSTKRGAIT